MAAMATVQLTMSGESVTVAAPAYSLTIEDAGPGFARSPYALIASPGGQYWTEINLLSSVHTAGMPDETFELGTPVAAQDGDAVTMSILSRSTAWNRHELRLRCTAEAIELSVHVDGRGELTDVVLLGGEASLPNGASGSYRSSIGFASVLVPEAGEPVQLVRPARAAASLGVNGDADPGRLNAIFSPPPLAIGFTRALATSATDVPEGDWLGLSVRDRVDRLTFTAWHYEPLDGGFRTRFSYEGHTAVDGAWASPTLVLRPAADGWSIVSDHRADLVAHGFAGDSARPAPAWWSEPIFCGWGAQCARAVHGIRHVPVTAPTAPESPSEENTIARAAPSFARQEVYDEFLGTLSAHGIEPGTIVIDDRWQAEYGSATTDLTHWPDLKGWIAQRHAAGQKVLLWWKAWDPEGIPAEECIVDAGGRPIAVDPGNPAYLARLASIVDSLLSPDGLDADGFKVDFTQRTPSGRTLSGSGETWGIAALHRLLSTLHSAAKAAKPDSLVICHAVHPSFGDTFDMVRLNDVSKYDIARKRVPVAEQVAFRHAIATRALPHHLIDTDQWPMPNRAEWLSYARVQSNLGVPALYYVEAIDRSGEPILPEDLDEIASLWAEYRAGVPR